ALLCLVAFELERRGDDAGVERRETGGRIDGERGDLFRRLDRDLLDVHAAFGRGDEGHAPRVAIDEERKIELAPNGNILDHIDLRDRPALWPGLRRDQRLAQQALCMAAQLFKRLHQLDAATLAS